MPSSLFGTCAILHEEIYRQNFSKATGKRHTQLPLLQFATYPESYIIKEVAYLHRIWRNHSPWIHGIFTKIVLVNGVGGELHQTDGLLAHHQKAIKIVWIV